MRTTIDINDALFEEVIQLSNAKTKKEAVRISEMEGIPVFANPIKGTIAENAAKNLGLIIKAKADKAKRQSAIDKAKKTRH